MTDRPRPLLVSAVSLDCADHAALAAFYAELFDGTMLWSHDGASAVDVGGLVLVAQAVGDHHEPPWPDHSIVHLDVTVDVEDLEAQTERAVSLGARRADPQPDDRWRVLLDPAGHPFCLTPFAP